MSSVGGAAGPLYDSAFRAMGKALPESEVDALTDGLAAIQQLGAAVPGDKTIVDAYAPAITAWEHALSAGADLATAAASATRTRARPPPR